MSADIRASNEIHAWFEDLRARLENTDDQLQVWQSDSGNLEQGLFEIVERLISEELTESQQNLTQVAGSDEALVSLQEKIAANLSIATEREFEKHLSTAMILAEELEAREQKLTQLCKEYEEKLASLAKQQARTTLQRKTIARELRAQKAEFLASHDGAIKSEPSIASAEATISTLTEELTQAREQHGELAQQLEQAQARYDELAREMDELIQISNEQGKSPEVFNDNLEDQLRSEIEGLQSDIDETEKELEEAFGELGVLREKLKKSEDVVETQFQKIRTLEVEATSTASKFSSVQKELEQVRAAIEAGAQNEQATIEQLTSQLHAANQELVDQRLEHERELMEAQRQARDLRAEWVREAGEHRAELHRQHDAQLEEFESQRNDLERQLIDLQRQKISATDSDDRLEREVERLKIELEDLRIQNNDLASQVARNQMADNPSFSRIDQESLTWEERKHLIMQQLEAECDGDQEPVECDRRLEIDKVIRATNLEIQRRDEEIEELRRIVEQQANTTQGVAIGAAAIAGMVDNDELVQLERMRLKEIQSEWEEKLRQAEIDLSMERAKLARERSQLETEISEIQSQLNSTSITSGKNQGNGSKTRRWLDHLGLREENK
ncbi:MAG: hypothetical protein KDB03_14980 [Planctomycetales bacterium]|nr:hypothetical protein [Planctomycetales bacterium]